MKRVDVAYAFVYDQEKNKVLIVKNRRGDSFDFTLPGGAAEGFFTNKNHHAVFHTFYGTITGGELELTRPEKIADCLLG